MTNVVDASVVLAIIFDEPGGQEAVDAIADSLISTVNLSEVLTRCIEQGAEVSFAAQQIDRLNIAIVPFTADDARTAAELRKPTRHRGLSLGDRACLALARREGLPVLTADRRWEGLDVGVEISLIR
ncbi:type II toxin-antitoxin system VapC family toxin [Blastomonas sp.]|uniref:type II toxin-antitoxin system VapC family toxin n=1 Tax=Blastomonas sp. TaxID=1909299 RepID=UPI003594453A